MRLILIGRRLNLCVKLFDLILSVCPAPKNKTGQWEREAIIIISGIQQICSALRAEMLSQKVMQ